MDAKLPNPYKETGASYKEIRLSLGLSQQAWGTLVNQSQSTISRWENGRGAPDVVQDRAIRAIEQQTGNNSTDA